MKRKILIDRPKIASSEIIKGQDFGQLMDEFSGFSKEPIYKTGWFITTIASISILLVGIWMFFI